MKTLGIIAACAIALTAAATAANANPADEEFNFPSIDCKRDFGATVDTICNSVDLRSLDRQIAHRYSQAYSLAANHGRHTLKLDQRRFLADRDDCGANEVCLVTVLSRRAETIGSKRWK